MRSCVRKNEWSDADVFNTLRDVVIVDLGNSVNETALYAAAVCAGVLAPLPAKSIAAGDLAEGLNRFGTASESFVVFSADSAQFAWHFFFCTWLMYIFCVIVAVPPPRMMWMTKGPG